MTQADGPAQGPAKPPLLQPAPRLRRIEIIANEHSGSVGEGAAAQAEALARGLEVCARAVAPHDLRARLEEAVAAQPDLLVVIAGDGTANMAATLCGPTGPLLAPLAGGTMNMLPRALYGHRDWRSALRAVLEDGAVMPVAGGDVGGNMFHVAAILGNPALWAPAREAIREGRLREALRRALYAWKRAFRSKLHYTLDDVMRGRAEALGLLCPLVSQGISDDTPALEAAAANPPGMLGVLRLGVEALVLPALLPAAGAGWRHSPFVRTGQCTHGHASSRRHINAILDGEPIRLPKQVDIRFVPVAFRALVVASDGGRPPGGGPSI
jgi:diacylglycerol kinase family enzyme